MPVKFKNEVSLDALNNATTDTDKFLVSDSGIVKYRTGTQLLSDLGITPGVANDVQNLVKAGVAINKGQAVYVTGADGTNIIVGLASNTSEATSSKTLGLLNATVAINGMADVVQIGRLSGLNTIGATAGDPVWLGTNGNLIYGLLNKPYAPKHLVFIGIVTRVNANNGEIFINVQNGFELNEIHDVDLKTNVPINGDVLGYDGTLWVNKTIAEWLGYTPANANGTTNYVSKFTGATTLGDSQIFDNGTFVGIGTNAPNATLQVGNGTGVKAIYVTGSGTNLGLGGLSVSFLGFATGTISTVNTSGAVPLGVGTRSTQPLVLGTNNAERMRIDSTGNVGIGTASTNSLLQVGSSNFVITDRTSAVYGPESQTIFTVGRSGVDYPQLLNFGVNQAGLYSSISARQFTVSTENNLVLQPNGGNVGIGTTSPSQILHLYKSSYPVLTIQSSSYQSSLGIDTASGNLVLNNESNAGLSFNTNATEAMRITSAGNVGIGTTSPVYRFQVDRNGTGIIAAFSNQNDADLNINLTSGVSLITPSTGILALGTSNAERMRITSGGNVGIGTISPSERLEVQNGTSGAKIKVSNTGGGYASLECSSNASSVAQLSFTNQLSLIGGNVGIGTTTPRNISGYRVLAIDGGNGGSILDLNVNGILRTSLVAEASATYLVSQTTSPIIFRVNGSDTAIINSSGNVGIGTTAPQAKLHINNGTDRNLWFRVNGSGTGTELLSINDAQSTRQSLAFSASSFYFDNGNVGIGTTSPSEKLQIYSSSNTAFSVVDSASSIRMITAGGINFFQSGPVGGGASPLVFSSMFGGLEYMRITSSGNVGIGTTSPVDKLEVNGGIRSTGLNGFTRINDGVLSASRADGLYLIQEANAPMIMWTNNTERMRITSDGNVGIGTTSPYQSKVHIFKSESGSNPIPVLRIGNQGNGYISRIVLTDETTNDANISYIGSLQSLGFGVGASLSQMIINSSGNVGIGTTSPSAKLNVYGDLHLGAYSNLSTVNFENRTNKATFSISTNGVTNAAGTTITYSWADGGHGPLKFNNSSSEVMRLSANGNIGIGTTNTIHQLSVASKIGGATFGDSFIEFPSSGNTIVKANNDVILGYSQSTSIKQSGNVGIGTTSPSGKFEIDASGNFSWGFPSTAVAKIGTKGTGGSLLVSTPSLNSSYESGFAVDGTYSSGKSVINLTAFGVLSGGPYGADIAFRTTSQSTLSEKMRITSDGNVGIGTTSPLLTATGRGNVTINGSNDSILSLGVNGVYSGYLYSDSTRVELSSNTQPIAFVTNGNEKMRITSSGNVGIGLTSPNPSALLHLKSTTQGFLPPVMKTGERDNIGSPAVGLMIFNKDDEVIQVYTGDGWRTLAWA